LREKIEIMKEDMERVNNYTINMAQNPAKAVQQISDPILSLLNEKVEDC